MVRGAGIFFFSAMVWVLLLIPSSGIAGVIKTERWCDNPVVDATYYTDGSIKLDVPARGTADRTMTFIPTPAPTNPEPTPTPTDTTRGYITFIPAGRVGVLPEYRPATSEITNAASIFASPGEYEQVTFAIRPIRDLGTVTFTCSDLTGPGGAAITSTDIDVYIIEPTVEQFDNTTINKCKWVAKWLRNGSTATAYLGKNVQVYVDVHVPAGAASGIYTGSVGITSGGGTASSFSIQLEVMPLTLNRPIPWNIFFYDLYRPGPEVEWNESFSFDLAEMRRVGITQCVLSPIRYSSSFYVAPDGSIDCQYYDYWVQKYLEAGFEDPPIIAFEGLMYNIFEAKGVLAQYPFGSVNGNPTFPASSVDANTRAFAGQVLQNLYNHSISAGWGPFYAYFADEPYSGSQTMEKAKFMCGCGPAVRPADEDRRDALRNRLVGRPYRHG